MQIRGKPFVFALAILIAGIAAFPALAEDEVTPAAPNADAPAPAPETPAGATEAAPTTPSPIHTMMMWVSQQVMPDDCACPSTEKGAKAWRAWFAGDNVALQGLRDALVDTGWTADRTITFFEKMAAEKCCGDCDGGSCDGGDCDGGCPCDGNCPCDKGEADAQPDAVEETEVEKPACTGCPNR